MPRAQKGQRFGGRKKGTPNKVTGTLKEMILQALADAGGTAYLQEQSKKNPTAFLSLVGRVLPLQVSDSQKEPMMPTRVVNELHPSK
jgi:hypothetical protein